MMVEPPPRQLSPTLARVSTHECRTNKCVCVRASYAGRLQICIARETRAECTRAKSGGQAWTIAVLRRLQNCSCRKQRRARTRVYFRPRNGSETRTRRLLGVHTLRRATCKSRTYTRARARDREHIGNFAMGNRDRQTREFKRQRPLTV